MDLVFTSHRYLGVELFGQTVTQFYFLKNYQTVFQNAATFYIPFSSV